MKTALKQSQRIDYVDILRGIGILIMIMGHVGFGGKFDRYIHSFHMPLFFFISGYFFKIKSDWNFKEFVARKSRQLLIPYISFGIFHYIVWLMFFSNPDDMLSPLINLVTYNTKDLPIAGALWFFTALFFTDVIYSLFVYNIKNEKQAGVCIMTVSIAVSLITTYTNFRLPLTLDIALVAIGFYHTGRLLKIVVDKYQIVENLETKPIKCVGIGVLLLFANAVLSFVNDYVNMKSGWYAILPLTWINAIIGVSAFFIIAVWCNNRIKPAKMILSFIGKNSIVYLCLNQIVILIFKYIIGAPIGNMGDVTVEAFANSMIIFIFTILILSVLVVLFNNTPLKKIIGK